MPTETQASDPASTTDAVVEGRAAMLWGERLASAFREIAGTRMAGIPILNPALAVEAVGFRSHNGVVVGILITPWFLNLVVAADPDENRYDVATRGAKVTTSVEHVFPGGTFPFLVSEEESLGRFAMCSLFSPVLEFADQPAAVAAAEAALAEVFDAQAARDDIEEAAAFDAIRQLAALPTATRADTETSPSRRALLTGRLVAEEGGGRQP